MNSSVSSHIKADLEAGLQAALGCSDPGVIAYASALAAQYHQNEPIQRVILTVSGNLFKNASIVAIPHCKQTGVKMACACGCCLPAKKKLMLLEDMNEERYKQAEQLLPLIELHIANDQQQLYLEVKISSTHQSIARITNRYQNVSYLACDGQVVIDLPTTADLPDHSYTLRDLLTYCLDEEQDFSLIEKTIELNKELIGYPQAIYALPYQQSNPMQYALMSAIEARMQGAPLPVMSNSGSGNQGIMATVPIYVMALRLSTSKEKMLRACTLSNALTIYIKKGLGEMSWICGGCISGCGVAAALTYLGEGNQEQIELSIINMIANVSGMICDGAKSSCALKMSTCLHGARLASQMALDHIRIPGREGILQEDVEGSIRNLIQLGKACPQVDQVIQQQLLAKQNDSSAW